MEVKTHATWAFENEMGRPIGVRCCNTPPWHGEEEEELTSTSWLSWGGTDLL